MDDNQRPYAETLGTRTWGFLHEFAKGFKNINRKDSLRIYRLVNDLANVYPCGKCRRHFKVFVTRNKPLFRNGPQMRQYFCKFHNSTNVAAGKPEYDCSKI